MKENGSATLRYRPHSKALVGRVYPSPNLPDTGSQCDWPQKN